MRLSLWGLGPGGHSSQFWVPTAKWASGAVAVKVIKARKRSNHSQKGGGGGVEV